MYARCLDRMHMESYFRIKVSYRRAQKNRRACTTKLVQESFHLNFALAFGGRWYHGAHAHNATPKFDVVDGLGFLYPCSVVTS
jgi:hypothetical protein